MHSLGTAAGFMMGASSGRVGRGHMTLRIWRKKFKTSMSRREYGEELVIIGALRVYILKRWVGLG